MKDLFGDETIDGKQRVCVICGNGFIDRSHKGRKYCSAQCQRKGQVTEAKMRAILNRQKNGYTRKKFDIQDAYNHKCAVCGWQITDRLIKSRKGQYLYSYGCEVHHIVPVSEGGTNESSNLILLCPNCHKRADVGVYSVEFLQGKTIDTEQALRDSMANNTCSEAVSNLIFGGME